MARRSSTAVREREDDEAREDAPRSRRGRSRSDYDADESERSERRGRRGSEDDKPRERTASPTVGKGWGGYNEGKERTKRDDYVNAWKVPETRTLIKMLDAEPFCSYDEHWPKGITSGKRSFVCLGKDECPLCDIGEHASTYALFNILDLSDPDNPTNEFWKVSRTVGDTLLELSKDKPTSPLNREDLYFVVWKSKVKGRQQTNINTVKARDIKEDYDCDPLTPEEIEEYEQQAYTEDQVVFVTSREDLRDVARDLDD